MLHHELSQFLWNFADTSKDSADSGDNNDGVLTRQLFGRFATETSRLLAHLKYLIQEVTTLGQEEKSRLAESEMNQSPLQDYYHGSAAAVAAAVAASGPLPVILDDALTNNGYDDEQDPVWDWRSWKGVALYDDSVFFE